MKDFILLLGDAAPFPLSRFFGYMGLPIGICATALAAFLIWLSFRKRNGPPK